MSEQCETCDGSGELYPKFGLCPDCRPDPNAKLYEANERKLEEYREEAKLELQPASEPTDEEAQELLAKARDLISEAIAQPAEPAQKVHTVSPEIAEALQLQAKRIADLEAMLEAERTLRANDTADVERRVALERDRRLGSDREAMECRIALDAVIEALMPLARFATDEDRITRGMTEPVCLPMAAVLKADLAVKLHRALRR